MFSHPDERAGSLYGHTSLAAVRLIHSQRGGPDEEEDDDDDDGEEWTVWMYRLTVRVLLLSGL